MFRKLFSLAAFAALGTAALAADDDAKKPAPKLDKSKLFEKMDANGDGKVTKEEFKKFREQAAEKLKEKAGNLGGKLDGVFDKLFEKMDADSDGVITKEEFEKYQAAGGNFDPEKLKGLLEKLKEKKGKE